jgi:hypothetical protein
MGTLIIHIDGVEVYNKKYCCSSTGSVWFNDRWEEQIEDGDLLWNDADKWPEDVQKAVEDKLSACEVCCGGCV